jgi:Fur family ferric uptake transcriptional regulator
MRPDILKACGLKNTPGRRAVLEVLEETDGPITAEEVYRRILGEEDSRDKMEGGGICLSTVYRTLSTLAEKGLLLRSAGRDGTLSYQLKGMGHRHYLICTRCGATVPIGGCPLEDLERALGDSTGFAITGHSLELYGLCPRCIGDGKDSEKKR